MGRHIFQLPSCLVSEIWVYKFAVTGICKCLLLTCKCRWFILFSHFGCGRCSRSFSVYPPPPSKPSIPPPLVEDKDELACDSQKCAKSLGVVVVWFGVDHSLEALNNRVRRVDLQSNLRSKEIKDQRVRRIRDAFCSTILIEANASAFFFFFLFSFLVISELPNLDSIHPRTEYCRSRGQV